MWNIFIFPIFPSRPMPKVCAWSTFPISLRKHQNLKRGGKYREQNSVCFHLIYSLSEIQLDNTIQGFNTTTKANHMWYTKASRKLIWLNIFEYQGLESCLSDPTRFDMCCEVWDAWWTEEEELTIEWVLSDMVASMQCYCSAI